MTSTLYNTIHYWMVDHPTISQFEWDTRRTPGASLLLVSLATVSYISAILLLTRFPRLIPTFSSTTIRIASAIQSIFLCILSAIIVVGTILSTIQQSPPENPTYLMCIQVVPGQVMSRGSTFFWAHVAYLSKFLEFGDTLLILLSGSRTRRLSFLHVYHHATVPVLSYMGLARTQSFVFLVVATNGCVHVLMYAYYFARALGYRPRWKRIVTDCQILQFLFGFVGVSVYLFLHFTSDSGCAWISDAPVYVAYNASLLFLFRNFHLKNYRDDHLVKDSNKQH